MILAKPKIGIVTSKLYVTDAINPYVFRSYVSQEYIESFEKSGAVPVTVPVLHDLSNIPVQLDGLDGIVLSGGWDIDPLLYGEQPTNKLGTIMSDIDRYYLAVIHAADKMGLPVFGICKGHQALNVAYGGTLYQDIQSQLKGSLNHVQTNVRYLPSHTISIEEGSFVSQTMGNEALVNSHHHQGIKDVAPILKATAFAPDGIVEALEYPDKKMYSVQWHPEMMCAAGDELATKLITSFVDICYQ